MQWREKGCKPWKQKWRLFLAKKKCEYTEVINLCHFKGVPRIGLVGQPPCAPEWKRCQNVYQTLHKIISVASFVKFIRIICKFCFANWGQILSNYCPIIFLSYKMQTLLTNKNMVTSNACRNREIIWEGERRALPGPGYQENK